jgi:hypothetical protein
VKGRPGKPIQSGSIELPGCGWFSGEEEQVGQSDDGFGVELGGAIIGQIAANSKGRRRARCVGMEEQEDGGEQEVAAGDVSLFGHCEVTGVGVHAGRMGVMGGSIHPLALVA